MDEKTDTNVNHYFSSNSSSFNQITQQFTN